MEFGKRHDTTDTTDFACTNLLHTYCGFVVYVADLLRHKPKYTEFVATFRTWICKKLLWEDPSPAGYTLVNLVHTLPLQPLMTFSGRSPLSARDLSVRNIWFGVCRNYGPGFRRLFTKVHQISVHAREWLQFTTCFQNDDILLRSGDRRYSRSSREVVRNRTGNLMSFRRFT